MLGGAPMQEALHAVAAASVPTAMMESSGRRFEPQTDDDHGDEDATLAEHPRRRSTDHGLFGVLTKWGVLITVVAPLVIAAGAWGTLTQRVTQLESLFNQQAEMNRVVAGILERMVQAEADNRSAARELARVAREVEANGVQVRANTEGVQGLRYGVEAVKNELATIRGQLDRIAERQRQNGR